MSTRDQRLKDFREVCKEAGRLSSVPIEALIDHKRRMGEGEADPLRHNEVVRKALELLDPPHVRARRGIEAGLKSGSATTDASKLTHEEKVTKAAAFWAKQSPATRQYLEEGLTAFQYEQTEEELYEDDTEVFEENANPEYYAHDEPLDQYALAAQADEDEADPYSLEDEEDQSSWLDDFVGEGPSDEFSDDLDYAPDTETETIESETEE
jgi:hypothetical protein